MQVPAALLQAMRRWAPWKCSLQMYSWAPGLSRSDIRVRTALALPGYYRSEKRWDLLVVANGQRLLAVEFKSQVGPSFGNNFNNRTEGAIGNAEDIWTAYREGRFGVTLGAAPRIFFPSRGLPTRPCADLELGTLLSRLIPCLMVPHMRTAIRVLFERLILERKYTTACLTLATNMTPTTVSFPTEALNFRQFAAAVEAHAQAFVNMRS